MLILEPSLNKFSFRIKEKKILTIYGLGGNINKITNSLPDYLLG